MGTGAVMRVPRVVTGQYRKGRRESDPSRMIARKRGVLRGRFAARRGLGNRCFQAIFRGFDSVAARGWTRRTRSTPAMPTRTTIPGAFGPFDGDFDPFEDDEDVGVLIPLE